MNNQDAQVRGQTDHRCQSVLESAQEHQGANEKDGPVYVNINSVIAGEVAEPAQL